MWQAAYEALWPLLSESKSEYSLQAIQRKCYLNNRPWQKKVTQTKYTQVLTAGTNIKDIMVKKVTFISEIMLQVIKFDSGFDVFNVEFKLA